MSSCVVAERRKLSTAKSVTPVAGGQWQLALLDTPGLQNGGNDGIAIVATCAGNTTKVRLLCCTLLDNGGLCWQLGFCWASD